MMRAFAIAFSLTTGAVAQDMMGQVMACASECPWLGSNLAQLTPLLTLGATLEADPTGASVDESTKKTVIKLCNGCRAYDMEDCGLLDCYCQKSGSCDAAGPLLDMVDPWCELFGGSAPGEIKTELEAAKEDGTCADLKATIHATSTTEAPTTAKPDATSGAAAIAFGAAAVALAIN